MLDWLTERMWKEHIAENGATSLPPTSGKFLPDELDIAKVDLYSLRKQIGFVPRLLAFRGNIFSNIALGDPHAESQKIIEMAKLLAHTIL